MLCHVKTPIANHNSIDSHMKNGAYIEEVPLTKKMIMLRNLTTEKI